MSLIQHVSSVEGVDLEPLEDFGHVLERQQSHHTLSYDPIPSGPEGPLEKLEALAAYEVSQPKRIGESLVLPSYHSLLCALVVRSRCLALVHVHVHANVHVHG